MNKVQSLQITQKRLLHDWLLARDGETRFLILKELRTVEAELSETMRHTEVPIAKVRKYAVSE